ncbi:alpha/beta hydrolase [Nocardia sp. XZ_19_385]|uniref:alpha/beta hydrolase n=1 Tax=Nocardia sp. XZ_19_385 TaxID=2769488 RepID=UPI00188FEBBA|nr:alpha/beta hydrolase [Nocardia sp. XZ_19_385]
MRASKLVVLGVLAVALPVLSGCGLSAQRDSAVTGLVAEADAAPAPQLDWAPCADAELRRFHCAVAKVPRDYKQPHGPVLELALVRQLATDPERRIGTLFTAAGGPGGSGLNWARKGEMYSGEISRRFDVITFDQRGIGRSAQVRCFPNAQEQERFWLAATIPPVNPEQEAATERASRTLAAGCAAHSADLLPHLTTVDAARDMDLLRRALGEDKISYAGGSYASYLGQVYGALFGDRVRALLLGSMIDPEVYTGDTRRQVTDTAVGTEEVFGEFLRLCAEAGRLRCSFAGGPDRTEERRGQGSAQPTEVGTSAPATGNPTTPSPALEAKKALQQRDSALMDQLVKGPITVGERERAIQVHHTEVMQARSLLLYDSEEGWPALAQLLTELERGAGGNSETVRAILASGVDWDFLDSYTAITCADNSMLRQPEQWPAIAREFTGAAAMYGPFWLYQHQPCAAWPASAEGYPQRYTGPWTLSSDKPALLINNRYDPVTPLVFAQRAQQEMVNARLVVVTDGYGHEPGGDCVSRLHERYLVDLQLPAPGATCEVKTQPFVD